MPYAVVQITLDPIPEETLIAAFKSLPNLTDIDARHMLRDAFGILVDGQTEEDARTLARALAGSGIQTEVIDQQQLAPMPSPQRMRRAELKPEHLVLYDSLMRPYSVGWEHVILIAAGRVKLAEFVEKTTRKVRPNAGAAYGGGMGMGYTGVGMGGRVGSVGGVSIERKRKEESNWRLALELVLDIAPARHRLLDHEFNFSYLGERRQTASEKNFLAAAGDLIGCARNAILNLGFMSLAEDLSKITKYPSEHAFEEEIRWLLWRTRGTTELPTKWD